MQGFDIKEMYLRYGGCEIPESSLYRLYQRATEQLALYERTYTVTEQTEDGHNYAICAMMETMYRFQTAADNPQSLTLGSVSTTNQAVDTSPEALSKALYHAALRYLSFYRGVD
jgi:hypothetical protein